MLTYCYAQHYNSLISLTEMTTKKKDGYKCRIYIKKGQKIKETDEIVCGKLIKQITPGHRVLNYK